MQYRVPNANLDSGFQTVSIVNGDNAVVAPGRLCWPFNWCVVVFLSSLVLMSSYGRNNYYDDCGHDKQLNILGWSPN